MSNETKTAEAGRQIAESLVGSDPGLLTDVRDLIAGTVTWNEIRDVPGRDILTGNPIPDGKTEA